MFRLTSLALVAVAAGGVFAMRLLGQNGVNGWWVEGGLGFLVLASLLGLWVRSVNQNQADRVAHDLAIAAMIKNHSDIMLSERNYHRGIIDNIAKEKTATQDAFIAELREQSKELRERIEELEQKGRHDEGGTIIQ